VTTAKSLIRLTSLGTFSREREKENPHDPVKLAQGSRNSRVLSYLNRAAREAARAAFRFEDEQWR
jgi:hypothetical protein